MEIKKGATRCVILTEKYAIKLPRIKTFQAFLWGLLGNLQEKTFSRTKHPKLCPVLFSVPLGFCNVMPKAVPITEEQYVSMDMMTFAQWNEDDADEGYLPTEGKQSCIGLLNGQIVIVDYGGPDWYSFDPDHLYAFQDGTYYKTRFVKTGHALPRIKTDRE